MNRLITIVAVVVCLALSAVAGDDAITPYLFLQQTTLNNMKAAQYPELVREFKNIMASVDSPSYWIAGGGLTGNSTDLYFVNGFKDFSELDRMSQDYDKVFQAIKVKNAALINQFGEAETLTRGTIWKYAPELSFAPLKVEIGNATHMMIEVFHLRPGTSSTFANLVKEQIELVNKASADEHWIAYRSVAGGDTAVLFVMPLRTLADLDKDNPEALKKVMTPLIREHFESVVQRSVAKIDTQLIMLKPEFSRPSPQMVAANPDFWTVKEPVVTAEKKGKKAPKATDQNVGK